jgi:hypothetical protein
LRHDLSIREVGEDGLELPQVLHLDGAAYLVCVLMETATEVLVPRQAKRRRSGIDGGDHIVWNVSDEHV